MIVISLMAGIIVIATDQVSEPDRLCLFTRSDLESMRSDTPLRQVMLDMEERRLDKIQSGGYYDTRTSATVLVMDEFEDDAAASLQARIARLRVENDRLRRELEGRDPPVLAAFHLLELRDKLERAWEATPEGESELHEEMQSAMEFISDELRQLGVTSAVDEHEVRIKHRTDRRIPLDDILRHEEP